MNIHHESISIREIVEGYKNDAENGVVGYGGKLNIRPAYQREFVYKDKQRDAVIKTIRSKFPLNVMYWAKNEDGTFELLDGQQRTISFCEFYKGTFSLPDSEKPVYLQSHETAKYSNFNEEDKENFLNYKVDIYICEGNDKERLDWFRVINIAGEKLTDQELLNINYTGEWLSDAKRKFSKTNCVAFNIGAKFVKGSPIRQEYLETALDWISEGNIAEYMANHCADKNANELWLYFSNVIEWIKTTFNTDKYYRKEMLGLNWGELYGKYKDTAFDADELEAEIKELMENDEVTDKKGIYEYVLSGKDEMLAKKLSKRTFSNSDKRIVYERQNGICPKCEHHYEIDEMEGDHILPWWRGGKTTLDNLQMICSKCNKGKAGKMD